MFRKEEFGMPHSGGTAYPWVNEDREGTWRLLIWEACRRRRCVISGREGEKEGGVSIKMLDG